MPIATNLSFGNNFSYGTTFIDIVQLLSSLQKKFLTLDIKMRLKECFNLENIPVQNPFILVDNATAENFVPGHVL